MILLATTALVGLLLLLIYIQFSYQTNSWKKRNIPYRKCLPILGHNLNIILKRKSMMAITNELYNEIKSERYCGYMHFMQPMILLKDPQLIHDILVKDFIHFQERGLGLNEELEPLTGNLVHLNGDRWKILRHVMTPSFTSGKLKSFFDQILKCADELNEYIKRENEEKECRDLMQQFNLNVIGLITFGLEVGAFSEQNETSTTFLERSTEHLRPTLLDTLCYVAYSTFPRTARILKIRTVSKAVSSFFLNIVYDVIKYREETKTRRKDFLQVMIDLKEQERRKFHNSTNTFSHKISIEILNGSDLPDEDMELLEQVQEPSNYIKPIFTDNCIAANAFMFLSGGADITSSILSYMLYELAANPTLQERVQNEVDTVFLGENFDYNGVKNMIYLEKFINEVMRKYPMIGYYRRCTKDYKMEGSDLIVKKGETIYIPVYSLHNDPKYFPDPEIFNPDRFNDMHSIPKGVFMPFGIGPRMCIAIRLAWLLMKVVIAKVMSRYSVVLSKKTKLPLKMCTTAVVHQPVGGIWVHFIDRHS